MTISAIVHGQTFLIFFFSKGGVIITITPTQPPLPQGLPASRGRSGVKVADVKTADIVKGIHQHMDIRNMADFLIEAVHQLLSCPVSLVLKEPKSKKFVLQAQRNLDIAEDRMPDIDGAIVQWFLSTGKNFLTQRDLPASKCRTAKGKELRELENLGARLCLALRADDGDISGLLSVGQKPDGTHYSRGELKALKEIAGQAAFAIDKIRIYTRIIEERIYANWGKMALQVAHDLNSPLNNINVFFQLLDQDSRWREAVRADVADRFFPIAQKEISRAIAIIKDLLVYVRPVRSKTGSVPLHQLLDQVLEICSVPLREKAIDVRRHYHPEEILVAGEPEQLTRVFVNFIQNAIEAMEGEEKKELSLVTEKEYQSVKISVRDTGKGISEKIRDTIFTPFMTSGNKRGLGLGLSIVEHFIALNGGSVEVVAGREKGASFIVRLPLERRESRRQLAASVEVYRIPQTEMLIARDISASGLRLSCQKYISPDQFMKLFVKLPDDSPPIPVLGKVTWTQEIYGRHSLPYDVGLEFIDIGRENQEYIKKWMESARDVDRFLPAHHCGERTEPAFSAVRQSEEQQ
ncbi:MAG: ATP-binding protein [bacterium]